PWSPVTHHCPGPVEPVTANRPDRTTPLTKEQCHGELRTFAAIQSDPTVVHAFVRTPWAHGVPDPGRREEPRQIPLIATAASRMAQASAAGTTGSSAGTATTNFTEQG